MPQDPHRRRDIVELFADLLAHRRQGALTFTAVALARIQLMDHVEPREGLRQRPAAAPGAPMRGHGDRADGIVCCTFRSLA
jgi:hypothetical protein